MRANEPHASTPSRVTSSDGNGARFALSPTVACRSSANAAGAAVRAATDENGASAPRAPRRGPRPRRALIVTLESFIIPAKEEHWCVLQKTGVNFERRVPAKEEHQGRSL